MRSESAEQGACAVATKTCFGEAARRPHRGHAELCQKEGMTRHAKRGQHVVAQARPGGSERLKERSPGFAIWTQISRGAGNGAFQHDGGAVIQRVGQRNVRVDPLQAMLRQWEVFETGRADGQGVNRGADVVDKSGQRQLERPRAAADGGRAFVDGDGMASAR